MATSLQMTGKQPQEAIFKPALVLMAGRFLGFVAAFAIPVVLARVFTQTEFGTYKQIFLIFGTLFGVAQAGMAESLYYFLPQSSRRSGAFVFNALLVLSILGTAFLAILWLLREQLAEFLSNPALSAFIPYLGFYLLFMLVAVVLEIIMTVRKQHLGAATTYAASDLTRAVFYIAPVLLFADIHALMLGAIGFAALRLATAGYYVKTQYGGQLRADPAALRTHLGYALPFGLAGLIEVLQLNFHMYAVSYYFDAATFAVYAVGCLQIPLSDLLMTSTSNVMMVSMREKILAKDLESAVSIWMDSVRKLSLILFPFVACLLLVAEPLIVLLYTDSYQDSVPIFMIWSLSMVLTALLTDSVLRVFAETRFLVVQNLIRLTLVAATIHWLITRFELIGAVAATMLAAVLTKIVALIRIKSVMRVGWSQLLPWKALGSTVLIAAGAAVPGLLVRSLAEIPDFLLFVATGTVYCAAYLCLLLYCGPLYADEKRMVTQWLQSPYRRLAGVLK